MAEPNTAVKAALAIGVQLNNLLLVWVGMAPKLKDVFADTLLASQACTSVLESFQDMLAQDDSAPKHGDRTFTPAALEEIESLAIKCDLVYRAVILLLQKGADTAGTRNSESATDHHDNKSPLDDKQDYKTNLLSRPLPDLSSLKTLGLISKLKNHDQAGRDWLTKALDHCAEQLFWIHQRLLTHLQVAKHARQYVSFTQFSPSISIGSR